MKKLLVIFLPFIILISTNSILFSKMPENVTSEIRFTNRTSTAIFIKCYPVSLVFDGNRNYSILSKNRWNSFTSNFRFDYNNGVSLIRNLPDTTRIKKNVFKLWGGDVNSINFQFDLNDNEENYCSLGFGKYKNNICI